MPTREEELRIELRKRELQTELQQRSVGTPQPAQVPQPLHLPEIERLPDDTWLADRAKALKGGLLRTAAAVPGRLAGAMSAAKATSGLSPYSVVAEQVIGEQTTGDIKALRARAKDLYVKAEKVESTRGPRGPVGWIADLALGTLPQMGAATLASAVGGPVGTVAVAGGIGGEEVYQSLRAMDVPEDEAEAGAWVTAPVIGLLEKLQLDEVLKVSNKAALKELVTAARQKAFKSLAKAGGKIGVNELIHAGTGGLQEALQEATAIGAEVTLARDFDLKSDFLRVAGAFAAGSVLEEGFRAGRAGAQGVRGVVGETTRQRDVETAQRASEKQVFRPPSMTEGDTSTANVAEIKPRMTVMGEVGRETAAAAAGETAGAPVKTPTIEAASEPPAKTGRIIPDRPPELTEPLGLLTVPISELSTTELEKRVNKASPYHRWYKMELDLRQQEATIQQTPTPTGGAPTIEAASEPPLVVPEGTDVPDDRPKMAMRNADMETRAQWMGLPPVPEQLPKGSIDNSRQAAIDGGYVESAMALAGSIIDDPRPVSDVEEQGMNIQAELFETEHAQLAEELVTLDAGNVRHRQVADRMGELESRFAVLHKALRWTGTYLSHAMSIRKGQLGDNTKPLNVIGRAKRNAGGDLKPGVQERLTKDSTRLRKKTERAKQSERRGKRAAAKKRIAKLSKLGKLAKMSVEEKDAQLQDLLNRERTDLVIHDIIMNIASRMEDPSLIEVNREAVKVLPELGNMSIEDAITSATARKVRNSTAMEMMLKALRREYRKAKNMRTNIKDVLYWMEQGRLPGSDQEIPEADDQVVARLREVLADLKEIQRKSNPAQQAKLEKKIAFLKGRLAAGDYSTNEEVDLYKPNRRTLELQYEAARLNNQLNQQIAKQKPTQWWKVVPQEALRTVMALKASFDLSAFGNQGGWALLAHPVRTARALPKTLRAMVSDQAAYEIQQEILNRPQSPYYFRDGLELTQASEAGEFTAREEEYRGVFAERIPLIGRGIKGSNRAFATTLNLIRADSYDALASTFASEGGPTEVEGRAIAEFVNMATGRGNIGGIERTVHAMNGIMWAPRRTISRFQMLFTLGGQIEWGAARQPGQWKRSFVHMRGSHQLRKELAKEIARYLGGLAVVYTLGMMAGGELETDFRSSDAWKIRFGNTRLDPLSGLAQTLTLTARLARQGRKLSDGTVQPLSAYHLERTGAQFMKNKLTPGLNIGWAVFTGDTAFDGPTSLPWVMRESVMPLAFDDILKAMEDQGIARGTALSMLGILGMGVQVYGDDTSGSGVSL